MKIDYFDLSLDKEGHSYYLAGENVQVKKNFYLLKFSSNKLI